MTEPQRGEPVTVEAARDAVGRAVVYRPPSPAGAKPEQGYITGVSTSYVFVRYGSDAHGKATRPEDLEWL